MKRNILKEFLKHIFHLVIKGSDKMKLHQKTSYELLRNEGQITKLLLVANFQGDPAIQSF